MTEIRPKNGNGKVIGVLIGLISSLATLLAVFIAFSLTPGKGDEAMSMAQENRTRIEVLERELQLQLDFIKKDIKEIKELLKGQR